MNSVEFARAYFNFCTEIGEKPKDVLVSAGGALLMLGLRADTDDLDLDVREVVYRGATKKVGKGNVRRSSHGEYLDYTDSVSLHITPSHIRSESVNGVYIYSLEDLIKQKEKLASAPDRKPEKVIQDNKDIEALKELRRKRG